MSSPPARVLLVAHGYPPREGAGTEQHTAMVAEQLRAVGVRVHVLAATRAPGRPMYSVIEEPGVTRIVNNMPARPLASAERDRAIEAIAAEVERRFEPELVHVHHVQFLSSGLRFRAPVVLTLHDAWAWCAAGGQSLLPDGAPCPGPSPERCAPCASQWRPREGPAARALVGVAGRLSPWVAPERLHRLYQRLPERLRARARRGGGVEEDASAAKARNQAMLEFYRAATLRISPSRWLASQAEAQGLGPVCVLPHPAVPIEGRRGGGDLLFLGTVSYAKGADRVVRAWRRAFPQGEPGLSMHGLPLEPAAALGHPIGPVLSREGVAEALRGASALVMGSRWPENAPLVLSEARAAGCPVVAPAIGGVPELVEEGRDGLLYPPGDDEALVEALRRVVASPPGPARLPPSPERWREALLMRYAEALGGGT